MMPRRNKDRPRPVRSNQKRCNAGENCSENCGTSDSPPAVPHVTASLVFLPLPLPPLEFVTASPLGQTKATSCSSRSAEPVQRREIIDSGVTVRRIHWHTRWRVACGSGATTETYERNSDHRAGVDPMSELARAMWRNVALPHTLSESLESVFCCSEGALASWSKLKDSHEISQLHTKFWARRLSQPTLVSPPSCPIN
jgi:hypothetical protein